LLEAISRQKRSKQWLKDDGQYLPNPATWLNQCRWLDELAAKDIVPASLVPPEPDQERSAVLNARFATSQAPVERQVTGFLATLSIGGAE
jgi:hypothetical protein